MNGAIDPVESLAACGHVCWSYKDRAGFRVRALEYAASGIAAGQWIEYVGSGSVEGLRTELAGLDGMAEHVEAGRVGVSSVADFYPVVGHSDVVDPVAAVAARVAGTEKALAAGYTGFRAVVDATAMARSAEQRAAFARYEYLLDQKTSVLPVTALCAYDVSALGGAAVAELACLHPFTRSGSASFRLYADEGVEFALAGEIDLVCRELFNATLAHTVTLSPGPELVIDGGGLDIIDPRGLLTLVEHGRRAGATLVIRNGPRFVRRLVELLDLQDVRVEVST
ncbi:MAG: MEDS domain-containing protein [Pseudonocardia sp.]|nr:MEDS domain-containing protein [Pseudonocardia sp.]